MRQKDFGAGDAVEARQILRRYGFHRAAWQFQDECPKCHSRMEDWQHDIEGAGQPGYTPPIKEMHGYSMVRWRCRRCNATFRKVHCTDDEVA